jgi:alkylation response protein AidB-like acyl-CoA dehydrogenase
VTAAPAPRLAEVAALADTMRRNADRLDPDGVFPAGDLAALRALGVLAAPLPRDEGGTGLGTSPDGAADCAALLMALGRGSVALGRIVEGHVNALKLVLRDAAPDAAAAACDDARRGALFALWVTDPLDAPALAVRRASGRLVLDGGKAFCSGAGHADRALVTARDEDGQARMLLVPLHGAERVAPLSSSLAGVRGAATGQVSFSGVTLPATAMIGEPGDYLREPDFSAGAWRGSAVAAGALAALVEEMRAQLAARGRLDDPHQRARFGRVLVCAGTARLWVEAIGPEAEDPANDPAWVAARVNLGRTAVEAACLEGLTLVQRSLGLQAFLRGGTVERMGRDLATYLRQPAPDEALHEAAGHFATPGATW